MPVRKLGIIVNERKAATFPLLQEQIDWMLRSGFTVAAARGTARFFKYIPQYRFAKLLNFAQCLLSFGGDGTLLSLARRVGRREKPIIGVNTGGLGFLTSISLDEVPSALTRLRAGEYALETRMMLHVAVRRRGRLVKHFTALNDMVINRGQLSRLMSITVATRTEPINTYFADGLIIASPTGSTAYSLSAGGPVVHPRTQVFIIAPICPHSLTERPMIVPSDESLVVTSDGKGARSILTIDGQVGYPLSPQDMVVVSRERFAARLVVFPGYSFYGILRSKLHWGVRKGKAEAPGQFALLRNRYET
jgi:NAD+ kinase